MTEVLSPVEAEERVGFKELDARTTDGILVRLLWNPESNELIVQVADTKLLDWFEIEVEDHSKAYDVFHHPFAYRKEAPMPESEGGILDTEPLT